MKPRTLIFAFALFVVAGLAGWSLAPAPDGEADSQASDLPAAAKSSRSLTSSSRSGGRVPDDARMRTIRDAQNEGDRMNLAIALAKSLPLDQAGKWLDEGLFSQREGYALTLFTKILEKRWRTEDPDGYLVWQLGKGRGVSVEEMARLSGSNPDLLLASIRLIQDPGAQGQALAALAKARPDLALAELAKMKTTELVNTGYLYQIFREMAETDLATLQSAVEGLPFKMQDEAQRVIYGELLAKDFSGTLTQLFELPNGLEIITSASDAISKNRQSFLESYANLPKAWQNRLGEGGTHVFTSGMKNAEIVSTDWESYGLSGKLSGQIKGDALFSEVRGKPGALELFQNANLNEAGRRRFLDMLSWNGGEETIKELMLELEPADRDYVAKNMELNQGTSYPTGQVKTAADLSEALAKADRRSYGNFASTMRSWNAEEKTQFQNDYAAMQGEERHRVTAMLTGSQDLDLRTAAVDELLGNTEAQEVAGWKESNGPGVASKLAVDLLQQNADRATAWVGGLPEGDSRSWAMKNLAANWKNYDPAAAETWVDSLPAAQRQEVRAFLKNPGP